MKLTTFVNEGNFYKANFHTHSTRSDGQIEQHEVVSLYKKEGYQFLSLTDHNIVTKTTLYDSNDFLLVPGIELQSFCESPFTTHHIVGLCSQDNAKVHDGMKIPDIPFHNNSQALLDVEKTLLDLDFLTIYCHPTWSHTELHQFDFLAQTKIMEICNYSAVYKQNHSMDESYWESWLKQNKEIWGMAADDCHLREEFFGAWCMVKCKEFTVQCMLDSLKAGSFYSSTGPEIYDFYIEDGIAHVKCSPASQITFIARSGWGKCFRQEKDKLTEACLDIPKRAYMLRVVIEDEYGKRAWSNPIMRPDRYQYR